MIALFFTTAAVASTWTTPCEDLGRETWGTIVDVVDHGSAEQTDERLHHVRVHRPLDNTRLQRPVRASRDAEPGLVLCYGDWVETWHGTDVTLEEVGARALVTARGGSLLWIDAELRQVRGIVDYYVLDAGADPGRATPVPVALGYSDITAGRQHSVFRLEVLEPGVGEALITVSADDDVFDGKPAEGHGVTLEGPEGADLHVAGGQVQRVGGGRVLASSKEDRASALAELQRAKGELDALAAELWDAPPAPEAWQDPTRYSHRLVLQGIARPDAIAIDGERLPPVALRRVRGSDGRAALVTVGQIPIRAGHHEVQVLTWGEPAHLEVYTDDSSAEGATIEVARPGLPARTRWAARNSLLDPWIRPQLLELRPSLGGLGGRGSAGLITRNGSSKTEFGEGTHAFARLPVRLLARGGRLWLEGIALAGLSAYDTVVVTTDDFSAGGAGRVEATEDLSTGETMVWTGWELLAGLSGGNLLSWELGLGVVLDQRLRLKKNGSGVPRPQGFVAQPASRIALFYGTHWRGGVDTTLGVDPCVVQDLCSRMHLDLGLSVHRTLGRVDPFVRAGLRSSFEFSDDAFLSGLSLPTRLEHSAYSTSGLAIGATWRSGRRVNGG